MNTIKPNCVHKRKIAQTLFTLAFCLAITTIFNAHLLNDESNLWLACPICNRYKSDKITNIDSETGEIVKLFNPRTQIWSEHFSWTKDGLQIVGKTPTGRATVKALHLSDDADVLEVRSYWVLAGWHPPEN